jgi:hypothetical protein
MTDDQTYNQRMARRAQQELAEFENNPQATGQAILDRWWQSQRDDAAEYRRRMRELNPTGLKIW